MLQFSELLGYYASIFRKSALFRGVDMMFRQYVYDFISEKTNAENVSTQTWAHKITKNVNAQPSVL